MIIIKFVAKVILLPVLAAIIMGQWIGLFLNSISAIIFGLLSTLVWVVALLSFLFGQSTGAETIRFLILGFVLFIIPHIGDWIIERVVYLRCMLGDFMRS